MKGKIFVSLCLALAFVFSVAAIPVGALTFDKVEAETYATYKSAYNSISSSYSGSQYYKNFKNVPLTGDARTDTLAVALSQVGYQESTSGDYDGDGNGTSNHTEFNYNMGPISSSYAYAWCATFVSWSLLQGRATTLNTQGSWCRNHFYDSTYIWREVGCSNWALQLIRCGYFQKSAYQGGSYVPQPGDLIFFSWESSLYGEDHIGIVVHSDGSKVWTIEGNTSSAEGLDDEGGGVYFKSYSLSYSCITGYGVLPYATADVPEIDYSGESPTTGIYMATSGAKSVYASIDDTSSSYTLPKFSMFEVLDIAFDSNGKTKLYAKCEISGSTVYGWIYHGSATNGYSRTVQIYANPTSTTPEPEPTPKEEWTFDKVSGDFATYRTGANGASASYQSGDFYERYINVPLTGDKRIDTVAIALSQVGYKDSATEGDYDGVSSTTGDYTEYNYNMGDFGSGYTYGWSASFVSWALYQSRATDQNGMADWCRNNTDDLSYIWCEVGCSSWSEQLGNAGYLEQSAQNGGTYVPKTGDLIFFTVSTKTHIGIVVYCDGTTVWTVEGNTTEAEGVQPAGEAVCVKSYDLDYEYISAYGTLPYEEDSSVTRADYSGEAPTTGVYMTATGSKQVYDEIEDSTPAYVLPQYEMLEVLEIKDKADGTTMLYSKCRIDGVIVYGWIESDSSDDIMCLVQIYSNPAPDLLSDVYDITDENMIKGVSVNTTVSVLIDNVITSFTVKLFRNDVEVALDSKLATGMVLKTMDGDTVVGTYTIVVKGDVNGDGKVTGLDYIRVKRHILRVSKLSGAYAEAAKVLNGATISARDYIMIKRYVIGNVVL